MSLRFEIMASAAWAQYLRAVATGDLWRLQNAAWCLYLAREGEHDALVRPCRALRVSSDTLLGLPVVINGRDYMEALNESDNAVVLGGDEVPDA